MKFLTLGELICETDAGEIVEKIKVKKGNGVFSVEKIDYSEEKPLRTQKTCLDEVAVVLALGNKTNDGNVVIPSEVVNLLAGIGKQNKEFKGVKV
jgi:hypothetical protein